MLGTLALTLMAAQAGTAGPCEALKSLKLPNTTVSAVEFLPAGPLAQPAPGGPPGRPVAPAGGPAAGGRGGGPPATILPARCRVAAVIAPTSDSHIEMELWMPAEGWNGKFQFVGGGGWAGNISYPAMATALREGYATASTDTGHKGGNALFAIGHPEKLVDFAYRAVHETTLQSKAMIAAHYGRAARLSYWNGCSTGGRQGLMAAQRYPDDFDAILAGAPANNQTHMHAWDVSVNAPILRNPAAAVPAAKLDIVTRAVTNACDANDGVKDGLLNDPRACKFDVAALQCKAGDESSCLTADQVASLKRAYGPLTLSNGTVVFPGKELGSETGLGLFLNPQAPGISVGSFQAAYQDANWDPKSFDVNKDLAVVDQKVGSIVNAVDPDLRAFKARGGKLIIYHGWNDTAISPGNAIDYYTSVQKKMGGRQEDFVRLFMVPGMNHCGGGPGPNQMHWMGALERWRELNTAPARIEAALVTNNQVTMTRPLCPYPQVAVYNGAGSTNDAANFSCKAP
jgi:feruloyl esterase